MREYHHHGHLCPGGRGHGVDLREPVGHLRVRGALPEDQQVEVLVAGEAGVDGAELGIAREVPEVYCA